MPQVQTDFRIFVQILLEDVVVAVTCGPRIFRYLTNGKRKTDTDRNGVALARIRMRYPMGPSSALLLFAYEFAPSCASQ